MALTSKVISGLCGQYKNIDIRAIYVRNQSNPQWYCAFLKIYFTNDIKGAIEGIHKDKYRLVSVSDDDLRFVSECADINEATRILKEINDMKVTINGINATLHPYSQNLFEQKLDINKHGLESYLIGSQHKDYPSAFISIDSTETPFQTLATRGYNVKNHAYRNLEVEINTFLDTNDLSLSNRNGIIIFPIYWKKLKLDPNEELSYLTKFELDSSLLTRCKLSVYSIKDSKVYDRIDSSKLEKKQNGDMTIFSVSLKDVDIKKDSRTIKSKPTHCLLCSSCLQMLIVIYRCI